MSVSIDKALLSEILEVVSAVQSYLEQDLESENLSPMTNATRQLHSETLKNLKWKIQSTHPINPMTDAPGKLPPRPPPQQRPPPMGKPPPPVPANDANYDILEMNPPTPQVSASEYLAPSQSQEDAQEEYLEMERHEDQVQEETYEEFSQAQDNYSELTVDSVTPSTMPKLSLPPTQPAPPPPMVSSQEEGAAYTDPKLVVPKDQRASTISEDMIADWEATYLEGGAGKKKEKVKASSLKEITMQGYLEKLGGRNQNSWQKRFAVVSGMFLYFYEKESSSTYNNRIPVPGFVPNPVPKLTRPQRKEYAFKLSNTSTSGKSVKDYFLRVKTEEERTKWMDAIRSIFELGKGIEQTRKAMTLPAPSFHGSRTKSPPQLLAPPPIAPINNSTPEDIPQEDYEAVQPIGQGSEMEPQEDYEALDPIPMPIPEQIEQEAYEALEPIQSNDIDQEEYMDVTSPEQIPEEQEEYVDLQPLKQQHSSPPITSPPPITTPPPTRPPQQPIPATRKGTQPLPPPPEPVVNTNKVYIQQPAGIEYKRVYVLLWDFSGADHDELSVKRGDLVLVKDPKVGQEWWYGELLDQDCSRKIGPSGLFPSSYSTVAFELAVA